VSDLTIILFINFVDKSLQEQTYRFTMYFSVGYTTSDVLYQWNSRAVVISDDLRMSQFDLIAVPSSNETFVVGSEKSTKTICELLLTKMEIIEIESDFY
jgi:hypothetical protein